MTRRTDRPRTLLVAHPSPDVYGSDRQLLESLDAVRDAGWTVAVAVPGEGPLLPLLRDRGARVLVLDFPVLRKSLTTPTGLVRLAAESAEALVRLTRLMRRARPDALYVNTVTNPIWLVAGRLAGVPTLCHVHEAEESHPRLVRLAMAAPLLLARRIIANSAAASGALTAVLPALAPRIEVVHNGVPGPEAPATPAQARADRPARLAFVGRLSPRKGPDVALESVARLRGDGREVELDIYGSVFPGYEWFEEELRTRAEQADLAGRVRFHGYVHPTWPALAESDVVLVPSRVEPFGNTAVEALLARRPVVASAVQGLREVIKDGETGILVAADDPSALAAGIATVLDAPDGAAAMVDAGHLDACDRFAPSRYRARILEEIEALADRQRPRA